MEQKVLVAYFSASGTTKGVAQQLAEVAGADLHEIKPEKPYTDADLDWNDRQSRSSLEMQDKNSRPAIKDKLQNMKDYDVVYVGFPIWWYTCPTIINTFMEAYDFQGKTVIPFCTFGSGGLSSSTKALKEALPQADIRQGYGIRQARIEAAPKELNRFLIENGYKQGTVAPLPEYSEQVPVTQEDSLVFDAACSGYQFPLGTPVSVGKRETEEGTDYKFTAKSIGFNGQEGTSTILVTVSSEEGAKPEFTEVIRE